MFNAIFISTSSGVSSKTGREWAKIELIATTVNGGQKVIADFCTLQAHEHAKALQSMTPCKVACGVTENGFLTISDIRATDKV